MERLQKLLAAAGVASRRGAEKLIVDGRVKVNGQVVTQLGTKAEPTDRIEVDGQVVQVLRQRVIMLHKPVEVVTTRDDPHERSTVYDLLYEHDRVLHPVGRLDRDSAGLLLLTNDGELTYRLTHPKFGVEKAYHVLTDPPPTHAMVQRLRRGVRLEDGFAKPKHARLLPPDSVELVLTEGRNREVRRILEALDVQVEYLLRVRFGPQWLGNLRLGKARPLNAIEVQALRDAVGLTGEGG